MTGSSMKINWNFQECKWEGITIGQVQRWEKMFPDIDVVRLLKQDLALWLEANMNNKKAHKKNWTSFILKWLKREQERRLGR